jgi:hypothetical protein
MKRTCPIALLVLAVLVACAAPASPEATDSPVPSPFISPLAAGQEDAGLTIQGTGETSPIATPSPEVRPTEGAADAETGGREAVFPNTIIVYQREGVEPADTGKWTIYRTGRIVTGDGTEWQAPEALVAPLFEFVESPGAWEEAASCPAGTAECPECAGNAVHNLTVYGQGEVRQLALTEGCLDLTGPLRSALDAVASQGQ